MDEQKMPRRPRRDHDGEQPQKSESLVYGKNPVTELLKSGSGVDTVLLAEGMAPAVAAYFTAMAKEAGATVKRVHPNKLRLMEKKRPQNFLLTGMSDFSHWKPEWREQIFAKMTENPQHQYLFLTKRPENIVFSTTLENAWFGVTVTSSKEKNRIRTLREHIHGGHYHVTFEPMFDDVGMVDLTGIEWIVIGTETGHRKGKAVSKPEWVWNLTHQAHALGIPVFMKEDLLPIMGEAQMVQEFPPAFYRVLEEQKTWRK